MVLSRIRSISARYFSTIFGCLALSALVLSSCEAKVFTKIELKNNGTAKISSAVSFSGEIASAFAKSPTLESSLLESLKTRGVDLVKVSSSENEVIFSYDFGIAEPSFEKDQVVAGRVGDQLEKVFDLTGVKFIAIEPKETGTVVKVRLEKPYGLLQALQKAVENEPDAALLLGVYETNTKMGVEVSFPGGVIDPGIFEVEESSAVFYQYLDEFEDVSVSVSGSLESAEPNLMLWILGGAGAIMVFLGFFVRKKK